MNRDVLRVVAVMEASTVTGPAKNLIEFFRTASRPGDADLPVLDPLVVTFVRGADAEASNGLRNAFLQALDTAEIRSQVVPERFRFDQRSVSGLRKAVRSHTPDIVQTHSVKSHFLARISGLDRMFPWVAFHHGYTSTDLKMNLYNRLDRWSVPYARRVVAVCGPFADQMAARGVKPESMTILHNSVRIPGPVDRAEVDQLRKSLGIPEDTPVVLCVGRFSKEKGHVDLIEATAELRHLWQGPYRLVLVGDGPERAHLEQRVRSLGLSQNVIFAGHVVNVSAFYGLASVMALPSHSEGSPNVVLEAMAHGVPIVATAVGGIPEILRHEETGILIPPRDRRAMAEAVSGLLADAPRAQRLVAAARRRALDFTPEAYRRSLLNVYLQVLAGYPAG